MMMMIYFLHSPAIPGLILLVSFFVSHNDSFDYQWSNRAKVPRGETKPGLKSTRGWHSPSKRHHRSGKIFLCIETIYQGQRVCDSFGKEILIYSFLNRFLTWNSTGWINLVNNRCLCPGKLFRKCYHGKHSIIIAQKHIQAACHSSQIMHLRKQVTVFPQITSTSLHLHDISVKQTR